MKIELKSFVSFQKQFDNLTGTLNIFDMSFLLFGSIMLFSCFLLFPVIRAFMIHSNHILLSLLLCIVISYGVGLICRILGKKIAELFRNLFLKKSKQCSFEKYFAIQFNAMPFNDSVLVELVRTKHEDMVYSYMWMKLDASEDSSCRNRFLYVSRIWVLKAIYEGLIPTVVLLTTAIGVYCFILNKVEQQLWPLFPFVVIFAVWIIYLLAKEADYCCKTQIREVIVAYFDFIERPQQKD